MRITRSILVVILVVLVASASHATYIEGRLIFFDGSVKEGLVDFRKPYAKTIDFKLTKDADKEVYPSDQIETLIIVSEGNAYAFQQRSVYSRKLFKADTVITEPAWLLVLKTGYTTLYTGGAVYKIKKGILHITYGNFLYTVAQRPGEDAASFVRIYSDNTFGLDKSFRAMASAYFKDYPELVARIENKEFGHKDLEDVVDIYDKWKLDQLGIKQSD